MRKSPALPLSFWFTEKRTNKPTKTWEQNPCIYFILAKNRESTLSLSLTQTISWSHYETVLKQLGVLRDVKAQRRKGRRKRQDIFKPLDACCITVISIITLIWNQPWSHRKHTASKILVDHTQVIKIKVSFGLWGFCYLGCWVTYIHL